MNRALFVVAAMTASVMLPADPAFATARIEATKTCLTDNTSGKDRKALARWIFLSIGSHPEIAVLTTVAAEQREESNRQFAEIVTRLLTEDCVEEVRAMVAENGSESIETAFKHLGEAAMAELMGHPDVTAAVGGYMKHIDAEKIGSALRPTSDPSP